MPTATTLAAPASSSAPAALLIIAGASCAGKDTLVRHLLASCPELMKPVTTTTRAPRAHEVDGEHYHFRTTDEFLAGVARGEFLEHARVHEKYYGLTRAALAACHAAGRNPAVILDVQGVASMAAQLPVATVFVSAPLDHLERRMRAERPAEEIPQRLQSVRHELAQGALFDHIVQNPDGGADAAAAALVRLYREAIAPRMTAYRAHVDAAHAAPPRPAPPAARHRTRR